MAFGDNDNDIGMIQQAGESYAVENAVEKVKKMQNSFVRDGLKKVFLK